jgi:hypothetical protein
MSRRKGIALTQVGECRQTGCHAPLFAELLTPDAPRLCVDCAPLFIEQQERLHGLFKRSGGRLPPDYRGQPSA